MAIIFNGVTVAGEGIPAGGIILWSGSTASIPAGWYLCNGANGTPNLQDRFVVGAGSSYAVGGTGGATTASVGGTTGATTLTTAQMPSHNHSNGFYISYSDGLQSPSADVGNYLVGSTSTGSTGGNGSHTHSMSGTVDTRSLYYALAYIMKS